MKRCEWAEPVLVVPVKFTEWTSDDQIRQPVFLGLWTDKNSMDVVRSYDLAEMYGENYGYRSGLNQSMVRHLTQKIRELERLAELTPGDTALDIGSNDATSLKAYSVPSLRRIGVDPTGSKFAQYYPDDIVLVPDFFSSTAYRATGAKLLR